MIQITEHGGFSTVTLMLIGQLEFFAQKPFRAAMAQAQISKPKEIILNFVGVTFIDSAGLELLMGAQRDLWDPNCTLTFVVERGQQVHEFFNLVNVGKKFCISILEPPDVLSFPTHGL